MFKAASADSLLSRPYSPLPLISPEYAHPHPHTHTCTHTHDHIQRHTYTRPRTEPHIHTITQSHTHRDTHTHDHTQRHTYTQRHTETHIHTQSHKHTYTHIHTQSNAYTQRLRHKCVVIVMLDVIQALYIIPILYVWSLYCSHLSGYIICQELLMLVYSSLLSPQSATTSI